jgi:hypothetical protein
MTTEELLAKIGNAAVREHVAREALRVSEAKGQRDQSRLDRTTLSMASNALTRLIVEYQTTQAVIK